ncbi:MAG TPA: AraD1 family protein [Candidatus Limnocylindrales bacterium]|nr:AraD1 family protein [Candidatus Limnocylindrales bacterium]
MVRLVQLRKDADRQVALVQEPQLHLMEGFPSVYELAKAAIEAGSKLSEFAKQRARGGTLEYDLIYGGRSEWSLLPPVDHPDEPARCLNSGTGLTHLGSASDRQAMHAVKEADLTDSMKIYRWGLEGGRPAPGNIGISPEWFYKGNGTMARAHGEPLEIPAYAEDGGEEAEIAGAYLIAPGGQPYRLGMALGNEFSDHVFEKKNYLYLAGSKLRTSALGPELVVDAEFQSHQMEVSIERDGVPLWSASFQTGEAAMCHSLQNMEHHHFKYEAHRRPGDVHIHFFGTAYLSFRDGITLQQGDVIQVASKSFGRPLRNPVRIDKSPQKFVPVISIG